MCWPPCCCCCSSCRDFRKRRGPDTDPPTPDIKKKMTKRTWDGIVSAPHACRHACIPQQLRSPLRSRMRAGMACSGPRTPSTHPDSCRAPGMVCGRHNTTHSTPSLATPCTRRHSPSNPPLPAQMVQPRSTLTPDHTNTHCCLPCLTTCVNVPPSLHVSKRPHTRANARVTCLFLTPTPFHTPFHTRPPTTTTHTHARAHTAGQGVAPPPAQV